MFDAIRPDSYFANPYAISVALVSTVIQAVGLFVLLQRRNSATNRTFFLLCIAIGLWLYGMSLVYCSRQAGLALAHYRGITFLGVCHISPLVYLFSVYWLGLFERQKLWVRLNFASAAIFYLLSVTSPWVIERMRQHFWGFYPVYGAGGRIFLLFFFGAFLAAFYNFFSALRRETVPLRRQQIKLITLAFLISVTGSVDYLPKMFSLSLYPFGYLCVLSWILIVGYSIVRYRMMEIQTVIHKTILWAAASSVFLIPVGVLSYLGRDWLVGLGPAGFTGVVVAVASLFGFYSRTVQPLIDHAFQRRRWDLGKVFDRFTDELVHLKDLDELSLHIVSTIRHVLYVDNISLLLAHREKGPLTGIRSLPKRGDLVFEREDPFLHWLEKNDVVVFQEYLDLDPKYQAVREAAREYFRRVGGELCLPLVVSGRLLGAVNIGKRANLKPFSSAEISFISELRKTAAIALSNSLRSIEMQEKLRRWNVELEKKVEERTKELKETQAQLVQAEKLASIGTLAGGIAHEINNPLTAVLTNAQVLKMTGEVADKESLDLIEEGAKRCKGIIEKLMKYARKTAEVEQFGEVDLNRVVRTVADFLDYQLKQENIELVLELKAADRLSGVGNELEQVLTNLILNSRDAVRDRGGKGKIEVKTGQQEGFVSLVVSDNGCGIKRDRLGRIFDPFYTTKEVGRGTGLGLTICSGIIEKHKGKIDVRSQEGEGTTFTILLPNLKEKAVAVGR
jgi:signal transduction histidine kinase